MSRLKSRVFASSVRCFSPINSSISCWSPGPPFRTSSPNMVGKATWFFSTLMSIWGWKASSIWRSGWSVSLYLSLLFGSLSIYTPTTFPFSLNLHLKCDLSQSIHSLPFISLFIILYSKYFSIFFPHSFFHFLQIILLYHLPPSLRVLESLIKWLR